MRLTKTQIALFVALLAGNAIILSNIQWVWLRMAAALALTFALSGWAWLPAFGWLHTTHALERGVLVVGVSSLLAALALLITLLLPGPFTEMPALIALNLTTLLGLLLQIANGKWQITNGQTEHSTLNPQNSPLTWPSRRVWLILLAIIAVAAVTRLTRLGYAEFHEDELENMRLIVRAYKGEEYAPFLDSKGPIHWLLPAALWYLNGWGNEGLARTPMVITGLLLIPAMFALGKRMSGGREAVGLLAAGLVALNGFFVAYARHVENQSLIVFWGALAMWLAYRYWREQRLALLPWLGLALAVGLIAHPDMLLYLPVFGYVVWQAEWPHRANWRQRWPWLAGSGLLLVGLVALFYIPYLTDPDIGLVYQYFGSDRIGTGLFYNRVANLFDQDKLYSTRYHAPLLVLLLLWLLTRHFAGWGRWGLAALAGLAAAIVSTVAQPDWWQWGAVNVAFAPYALLTLLILLMPHAGVEIKTLILWFSVPLGALLFLAKDAADHVQVAYTGWAMLAALSLADLWQLLGRRRAAAWLKPALAASLAVVAGLILAYQYLAFDSTVTAYWQAKLDSANNPNSRYNWLYGSLPRPRKIFSNPRLGGWKVAGYLWQTGALSGDFRSINESFAVPVWYTFQTPRSCYEDPQHYWVRRDWQGWPDEAQTITEQGYTLTRVVLVDGQPKLHLYEKTAGPREPETLNLDDFRHKFDRLATPARFAQAEPISQPASFNFGDRLLLRGYDPPPQIAKPGDLLPVTVYWDTLARMDVRYRGFVHLVGANGVPWGQHDDDPACRLLTTDMRPGQQSSRQFRLPVAPSTPPGQYTVVFGLYHPDNFERLPIWDNLAGQPAGNSLVLGTVTIK